MIAGHKVLLMDLCLILALCASDSNGFDLNLYI
jgi:hypothetical protein